MIRSDYALKSCTFDFSDKRNVATVDFNGNCACYDVETTQVVWQKKIHESMINKIDGAGSKNGPFEIATAGRDGSMKLFDVRTNLSQIYSYKGNYDCWAVSFGGSDSDTNRSVAFGFKDGELKVLDMRKMEIIEELILDNGICHLEWNTKYSSSNSIMATCLNGQIVHHQVRGNSQKHSMTETTIWYGSHIANMFGTCDGTGSLTLFDL